jgi:hypothetical protein
VLATWLLGLIPVPLPASHFFSSVHVSTHLQRTLSSLDRHLGFNPRSTSTYERASKPDDKGSPQMHEVSLFRLYVLRAMYLFIVVGLGVYLWPGVLDPEKHWELMEGQASCMLAAFSLLCVLGLRYPLQMLPVLLWEVVWKTLWLIIVPLPQWMAGRLDESLKPSIFACSLVVLVYLAIPWRYVFAHYIKARGERWRKND